MLKLRLIFVLLLTAAFLPVMVAAQDQGDYVILNAQYGTPEHHVDVTMRLRELARQDQVFRMGNSTFGIDPDHGRIKFLRIYARGPDGQERMFEYREGSTVDGAQFRGWGRADWGSEQWDGGWEGHRRDRGVPQPEMDLAMQHLREAQQALQSASSDKGGHRVNALQLINQAMGEVQAGIQFDNEQHERADRDRDRDHDRH